MQFESKNSNSKNYGRRTAVFMSFGGRFYFYFSLVFLYFGGVFNKTNYSSCACWI